jgi:hypothetical protein
MCQDGLLVSEAETLRSGTRQLESALFAGKIVRYPEPDAPGRVAVRRQRTGPRAAASSLIPSGD